MREGYKQTEVGVIPEEWDVKRLGELADIQRGASPRPIDSPQWFDTQSQVGWVRITDVTQSKTSTLTATTEYLSPAGIANSRFLPSGSLIMSICATVGVPVITAIDTCIHDGFVGFSNLKSATKEYIYIVLKSLTKEFQSMGQTGSQANLNSDLVRDRKVFVPPLPEQRAIASALADVDALLASLEALLTKKRQLKQAAMQKLLTGKTRLEGFGGEWSSSQLKDLLKDKITYGIVTAGSFVSDGVPMIRGGDIKSGRVNSGYPLVSREKSNEYSRTVVQEGDVVMALVGYPGEAAKIGPELVGANISRAVGLIRLRYNISPDYLIYFLNSSMGRSIVLAPSAGSAQIVVNLSELEKIYIPIATLPEQQAITSILSEMDAELDALTERVTKTRQLKQGMMQELLTGRTRLV